MILDKVLPLLDWNKDSAENGCGTVDDVFALDETTGGNGVANNSRLSKLGEFWRNNRFSS